MTDTHFPLVADCIVEYTIKRHSMRTYSVKQVPRHDLCDSFMMAVLILVANISLMKSTNVKFNFKTIFNWLNMGIIHCFFIKYCFIWMHISIKHSPLPTSGNIQCNSALYRGSTIDFHWFGSKIMWQIHIFRLNDTLWELILSNKSPDMTCATVSWWRYWSLSQIYPWWSPQMWNLTSKLFSIG